MKPPTFTTRLDADSFSFEAIYDLPYSREQLWPILSRTDWLNRALGLPPVQYEFRPLPQGGAEIWGRIRWRGQEIAYRELPFEWVENEFYAVQREFVAGPLRSMRGGMEFQPTPEGATRVKVFSTVAARRRLWRWVVGKALGAQTRRGMARVIAHLPKHFAGEAAAPLPNLSREPVSEPALRAGLERLRQSGFPEPLVGRLENLLRQSSDAEVSRVRPFAIAKRWREDPWETLRLLLHATRCGLLDLRWEILCPNCRASQAPLAASLKELKNRVHCDVCQIRYDAQFDKSVELKFSVNPMVRTPRFETYCLAGPGAKPHVISQIQVPGNEQRAWVLPPLRFPARIRSPQMEEPLVISDAKPEWNQGLTELTCDGPKWQVRFQPGHLRAAQVKNRNAHPVTLLCERLAWDEEILTAARATNWQEFRDLFSAEVVSPEEQITIGSQIVLFTDLRGSTALYQSLGDAPAYALVRQHFRALRQALSEHHGALVKTIGDAVMAVFSNLDEAWAGVCAMHRRLAEAPGAAGALQLKSSLHLGPCLAVNANQRLDYFGSSVNLAARMVSAARGGDVVISSAVFSRPETQRFLKDQSIIPERAEMKFRGFEQPQEIWRAPLRVPIGPVERPQ